MSNKGTLLEIRNVSFRHRLSRHDYSEKVLNNVRLTVQEGEILILLGQSGAGKSTLLRLLNRLEDPQEGEIFFQGMNTREKDPRELRRQISLVLQEPFLIDGTVRDNLKLSLNDRMAMDDADGMMREVLASVGLKASLHSRSIQHLSIGEKQRVCIARTLMISPKLVLLDEPTSALDPENRLILSDTIRQINHSKNITFLVVTHIEEFARSLGGRIVTLKDGEVQ